MRIRSLSDDQLRATIEQYRYVVDCGEGSARDIKRLDALNDEMAARIAIRQRTAAFGKDGEPVQTPIPEGFDPATRQYR